jgi:hypothetical protein
VKGVKERGRERKRRIRIDELCIPTSFLCLDSYASTTPFPLHRTLVGLEMECLDGWVVDWDNYACMSVGMGAFLLVRWWC